MNPALLAALATTMATVAAQTQNNNAVQRSNQNWSYTQGNHPTTNNLIPTVRTMPPEWAATATTGVPAGTLTWRWIPKEANMRREARRVSGFEFGIAPSPATATFPSAGYFPEMKMHAARARTSGTGMEPDLSVPPLLTVTRAGLTFPQFGLYIASSTATTVANVNALDLVLSLKWEGTEHTNVPGKQGTLSSASESAYAPDSFGFVSPTNVITVGSTPGPQPTWPTINYYEEAPVVNAQSDWGQLNDLTRTPPLFGYGLGTAQGPLATTATRIAFDVEGGATNAGRFAVPLFNVGPVFPISIPALGVTLEVNLADPALTLLGAAFGLQLNGPGTSAGFGDGAYIQLPALGTGAIGTYLGMEFVIVDPTAGVVDSTQAYYIRIER